MNKIKVIAGLSVVTAALFSFNSCVDVNPNLGSKYVPSTQDLSMAVKEFDLPVEMRMCDSLQSSLSQSITVGTITSDLFGTFTAEAAFTVEPADTTIVWGDDPVFKEMYLTMDLSEAETLSDDQTYIPQNIHVYRLTSDLDSVKIFCNSLTEADYDPVPISLENSIYSGDETLRIYLSEEYGKPFFQLTGEDLDSTEVFMKNCKGFYFTVDAPAEGMSGGRLNTFDLSEGGLYLTYNSTNWKGVKRDTTVSFTLGTYYSVNLYRNESEPLSRANTEDILYLESLGGVTPYVSAKAVYSMIDKWAAEEDIDLDRILITKASMEFPFEYEGSGSLDNFPGNIYPCRRKMTSDSLYSYYSPLSEVNDGSFSTGAIDRSLLYYKPDCCIYLQSLLAKEPDEIDCHDDLWIMALSGYTSSSSSSSSSYYNPYSYYSSYYNPYSSYYGYSSYGYGYSSYYNPYYYSSYYGTSSSSSSGTTTYYINVSSYRQAILNGTKAERRPKLRITYTTVK